jgi:hypothetical protein
LAERLTAPIVPRTFAAIGTSIFIKTLDIFCFRKYRLDTDEDEVIVIELKIVRMIQQFT